MALEDIIDNWIAAGGEGAYPSLQVTRRMPGTLTFGTYARALPTFFNIAASIRPADGAEMIDEVGGRYQLATQVLYTHSAELYVVQGDTPSPSGAHECDEVTLFPTAAAHAFTGAHVDGTYRSRIVGTFGNAVTLTLASGSMIDAGELDETAWPAVVFNYKSGTTTVAQLEDALAAGNTLDVLVPASDPATVLADGDAIESVAFAGGGGETWRVIRASRARRFWKVWIQRINKP